MFGGELSGNAWVYCMHWNDSSGVQKIFGWIFLGTKVSRNEVPVKDSSQAKNYGHFSCGTLRLLVISPTRHFAMTRRRNVKLPERRPRTKQRKFQGPTATFAPGSELTQERKGWADVDDSLSTHTQLRVSSHMAQSRRIIQRNNANKKILLLRPWPLMKTTSVSKTAQLTSK